MKTLRLIAVLALALLLAGCARIGLEKAKVELFPDKTVLTITLSNKGAPIQMLPLEAKLVDHQGNEHAAREYAGNLTDPIGKNHGESVSGTITFPPLDPRTELVKIDLITLMIAKNRRYVSRIAGDVQDGVSENLTFRR